MRKYISWPQIEIVSAHNKSTGYFDVFSAKLTFPSNDIFFSFFLFLFFLHSSDLINNKVNFIQIV